MRPLSASDVVRIWELAQAQHPLDRALTILGVGFPEMTPDSLADLSLGQRDDYLLSLRELSLGPELTGHADCPQCEGRLEFSVRTTDLRVPAAGQSEFHVQAVGEFILRFRLPTSRDLAAVAACDPTTGRRHLAERCVAQAERGGATVLPEDLPEKVVEELGGRIAQEDPQAELLVNLACPACGHGWQMTLDVASFFWKEIRALARRSLYEVHVLAQAHGWSEGEILAMSAARRHAYIEILGNG